MNTTSILTLAFTLGFAVASVEGASAPIGFERFTDPDASSGLAFGLTETEVFNTYADPLVLGGLPRRSHPKDTRLIDIEIRADGSGLGVYVYDLVWVKNEGAFKRNSWLLVDLTASEVVSLKRLRNVFILDIERYPRGDEWRFSLILQRNPGSFAWDVFLDADLQDLMNTVSATGSRLIDIDLFGALCVPTVPRGQACGGAIVDAVIVENSGANYVPTANALLLTQDQYPEIMDTGYQIVDQEFAGVDYYLTIWVKSGNPFLPINDQTEVEAIHNHGHTGRVVDLEVSPAIVAPLKYHTINLP